jgi:chemotaxis protein methyltransferase CheR
VAAGRYTAWSLRATSAEARRRWFRAEGSAFVLDPAIRAMVTFEERNLAEEDPAFWRALGPCDLVLCRNVLMYFTPEHSRGAVRRLGAALAPGGYLFLGHAEALRGTHDGLELCHTHETFYYRRRGEGAPVAASVPGPAAGGPAEHWTEVIQRSSRRVASLAGDPAAQRHEPLAAGFGAPLQESVRPSWDLAPALEAVRQERFQDALLLLAALPPAAREDPGPLLLRAVLLTNLDRHEQSEEVCRGLLRADPANAGAHYLMALSREQAGDSARAAWHGQQAIGADPGFAMPHLHLGIMARRAGDAAAAKHELERALLLLDVEAPSRLLLFGGGFSRETLRQLCRRELRAAGGVG